jgi:hypothetical protein
MLPPREKGNPLLPPTHICIYIYIYRQEVRGSVRTGKAARTLCQPLPHHTTPPHPTPPHPTRGVTNLNQNVNQEKQEARRRRFNDESAERQRERKQNRRGGMCNRGRSHRDGRDHEDQAYREDSRLAMKSAPHHFGDAHNLTVRYVERRRRGP